MFLHRLGLLILLLALLPGVLLAPEPTSQQRITMRETALMNSLPRGWSTNGVDAELLDVILLREKDHQRAENRCTYRGAGEIGDYQIRPTTVDHQLGWRTDPRLLSELLCWEPTARIIAAQVVKTCWRKMGDRRRLAINAFACFNGGPGVDRKAKGDAYWYAKQGASDYAALRLQTRNGR